MICPVCREVVLGQSSKCKPWNGESSYTLLCHNNCKSCIYLIILIMLLSYCMDMILEKVNRNLPLKLKCIQRERRKGTGGSIETIMRDSWDGDR